MCGIDNYEAVTAKEEQKANKQNQNELLTIRLVKLLTHKRYSVRNEVMSATSAAKIIYETWRDLRESQTSTKLIESQSDFNSKKDNKMDCADVCIIEHCPGFFFPSIFVNLLSAGNNT